MKYLFLICVDATTAKAGPEETDAQPWVDEMDGRGVRLTGSRTRSDADTTTVKVRDGELLITDGPYIETKDLMAGFDVIDCADLDEAIEIAAKHPMARFGVIEVRPFWTE